MVGRSHDPADQGGEDVSRPIKFRAWDRKQKVMVYYTLDDLLLQIGSGSDDAGYHLSRIVQGDLSESTKMEFTGLHDKNGREIYEGDVVQLRHETVQLKGKVIPAEDGHWIIFQDTDNFVGVHHNKDRIEVIGNIYENPELAEGGAG